MSALTRGLAAASAVGLLAAAVGWSELPPEPSHRDAEAGAIAQNNTTDCSTVQCFEACPDGYVRKEGKGKDDCCGRCVKAGNAEAKGKSKCKEAADCDGQPHLACVGSWACVDRACRYTCDTTTPVE